MKTPLHLVLVTPEIPANTGNIMRLAAATGITLHLIEPLGFHLDYKELKRAVMDYRPHCQLQTHLMFSELEAEFPDSRFLFLSARASNSFFSIKLRAYDFLVMGPEGKGLSDEFLAIGNRHQNCYRLPMPGTGRSLNLATAAGIVVYESLRQQNLLVS